jgi:hypothetical protein
MRQLDPGEFNRMIRTLALAAALAVLGAAPTQAVEPAAPRLAPHQETSRAIAPLSRQAIFEILCGGMEAPRDGALASHLWNVAGSLAERGWTPPKVTVRVVASRVDR